MSAVERFRQAWDAKFPSEPPPDLPCLHVSQAQVRPENDAYGSVYGTVYSNLNPVAVEHALQVCNATIAELYLQLDRQQFIAEYLWEVLHGINSASVADSPPPPLVPKHSSASLRIKDRAAAVPLETDLSATVTSNSGLDNIVPIQESPSSCNFSPLSLNSVDGKVFTDDKTAGLINANISASESNSTDLDKCQQSIRRKNSLPLLDREQHDPELESGTERTSSLDSMLQDLVSVASTKENDIVTPLNSFRHKPISPSTSLPLQMATRQKPVPTPRVTVNKQVMSSFVKIDDSTVGESSTDDVVPSSVSDSVRQLQKELKHVVASNSFHQLSSKQPAPDNPGTESASSVDDDQKIRSVKQRALAFTSASSAPSSVPSSAQKLTVSDSLRSEDGGSPRQARMRRVERAHVYEEVVPVDLDEGGVVSSDDEEPLYYNLKMLQQTMLNRAKTFYAKGAQRPVIEQSKDEDTGDQQENRLTLMPKDDTHQLSGDSSK